MTSAPAGAQLTESELEQIAELLLRAGMEVVAPLTGSLIAGGRSNLTFRIGDGVSRWVLRTPPRAGRTPSAHDVAREFRVTSALVHTEVPVAAPVLLCEDETILGGPFAVASFVSGRSVQTSVQVGELSNVTLGAVLEELVGVLASLHRVDHVAVGLERFGRPDSYAERQYARWSSQWELVGPASERDLAAEVITALAPRLPRQSSTGIVHGDYRIDNTLLAFDAGVPRVAAVVDWELSTIGDPVADVAMMCGYRDAAFDLIVGTPSAWASDRLPSVGELATAYEAAGGVPLVDWSEHLALAYFKIAVIAAGIDYRLRAGAASGAGFDTAGDAVAPYLTLARDVLTTGG